MPPQKNSAMALQPMRVSERAGKQRTAVAATDASAAALSPTRVSALPVVFVMPPAASKPAVKRMSDQPPTKVSVWPAKNYSARTAGQHTDLLSLRLLAAT